MDPRRLLIFRAVARAGSISAAAAGAGLDPAGGEPAPASARAVGRVHAAAPWRGRGRPDRARTSAARAGRCARRTAAHGGGGARRPDRAPPRPGPVGGLPVGGGNAGAPRRGRLARPTPGHRRRADRGRATRGAGAALDRRRRPGPGLLLRRPPRRRGRGWCGGRWRRAGRAGRGRRPSGRDPAPADAVRPRRGAVDRRLRAVPGARAAGLRRGRASSPRCAT